MHAAGEFWSRRTRVWMGAGVGLALVVLVAVVLLARTNARTQGQGDNGPLTCTLDLTPAGGGEVGLAFGVGNPGSRPVTVQYYRPFIGFDLTADAADGRVPLVQPGYDVGVQPVTQTIGAGETVQIATPIRLRFDPQVAPSGGAEPTLWTLKHAPAPVHLQVTLRLSGATVAPCSAQFDPGLQK